jgi:hypothetical protein
MNPIIHIGYPKTATTWFQRNFYPRVEQVFLPHHNLVKKNIISPFDLQYSSEKYSAEFKDAGGSRRMIICEENLIGSLQNGGMQGYHTKETANRLKLLFPKAEIVIFIRNQPEMITSAYIQYVKGGGNYSLNKYLFDKQYDYSNSRMLFSFDFFKYHEVIGLYQSLFGKENVHVFFYEEFAENNREFVRSFAEKFSLKLTQDNLDYRFQNIRLRKGIIPLARFTNSFSKRPVIHKYYFMHVPFWYLQNKKMLLFLNKFKIFGKQPTAREILGKKIFSYINDYYRESNRMLFEKFNLKKLSDYNYPL